MRASSFIRLGGQCLIVYALLCWCSEGSRASAHEGANFRIEVVEGKLRAQGIVLGEPGESPAILPYYNAVHGHWQSATPSADSITTRFASASLPGFVIPTEEAFSDLRYHELSLELLSVAKWVSPPLMPSAGTEPTLQTLDRGEVLRIETVNEDIASGTQGELLLSVSIPPSGIDDIVLNYQINRHPVEQIHVLEWRLSAQPADPAMPDLIADSDPIYVLLSPEGSAGEELLRDAVLYLEEYLGTPAIAVPETSTLSLTLFTFLAVMGRGFRRS